MIIDHTKNKVFKINSGKNNVICPPEQVFKNSDFKFLLTIGGDLVDDVVEFNALITFLKELKETEIYIVENIGAIETDRKVPFSATIPINSDYNDYQKIVDNLGTYFGLAIHHFFVFGQNENWGIYICEWPWNNIIGCDSRLTERFASIFGINGNGLEEQKNFIEREYQTTPNLTKQLITNYKL